MASNSDSKRFRSKQFSVRETTVLRDMMEIKYSELNAKHINGSKRKADEIWKDITETVNAVGTCPRSVSQVKEKWRNMMKKAKADYSAERVSLGKTGGGPALPEMSETSHQICDFMRELPSFSGIPGATASETFIAAPLVSIPVDETDQEFDVDEVIVTLPTGVEQATKKVNQSGLTVEEKTEAEKTEIQRQPNSSANQRVNQSKPKTLKDLQRKYYQQAIENQRVQMECFAKVSKLADVMIAKFSTD